jgi:CRP-like cAMP-binding protein
MKHLLSFPWDTDIIYHEAGIPPLHTPVKYLDSLPDQVKERLTVYHIASKDFPKDSKLKLAKFGIGETLYPEIEHHRLEEAYGILDVFSRIDIFKDLPFERTKDLMLIVNKETFQKGEKIIQKDTTGDKFYVIVSGNVAIEGIENVNDKVYGTYEYFGEASLVLNTKRTADVVAVTNVEAFSIEKQAFLRLIKGTEVEKYIRSLASVRDGVSWKVIKSNPYFTDLTSSQVTHLESILEPVEKKAGETLLAEGDYYSDLWLFSSGQMEVQQKGKTLRTCAKGDLIGNFFMIKERKASDFTYRAVTDCALFHMKAQSMAEFLSANPGVLMKMMFDDKNR